MSALTRRLTFLDERLWHRLRSLQHFAAANRRLFVYLLLAAVAAFGYDLVSFSLKTDAELHASSSGAKLEWIQQGRWAMYFLNALLMPDAVMPFVPVLTGVLGLATGVLFFVVSLSEQRTHADYLAAPLAIGCPLLAFGFYFTTLGYGLGVALAAAGAGHYAMTRWRRGTVALAAALFAVSMGIYQATVLLIPVLFGLYLVARIVTVPRFDEGLLLRRVCVFAAVTLTACALYESITLVTLRVYQVPYAQEYLQTYLNWTTDRSYWESTLRKTFDAAKAYYTGDGEYYLYKLRIVAVLFWVALILTAVRVLVAPQSPIVKIVGFLALAAALCAPLLMHLSNGGQMPPRTVLGVPFVLAGLVFCATFRGNRTLNGVFALLVLACFFKFAVANNRYALASEMTWKADQDLSLLILQRVHSLWHKLPERSEPHPIVLVGMLHARESPLYVRRDLIGSSFYHLNGGSAERVVALWRSMRQFEFREASRHEALVVAGRSVVMPVWPADGSVDVIDGVIVVKIGDFTAQQILTLCNAGPVSEFCERDAQRLLALADRGGGTSSGIYEGLWVNSPAGSEEGWGLQLAHQNDTVFVSWFTYDLAGRNWWLTMSAQRQRSNVFTGTLSETRGTPFVASAFVPADVASTVVGNAMLTFTDANNATLDYAVKGVRRTKAITRPLLGAPAPCALGGSGNAASASKYGGLWWAAPALSEPGWGLSLDQDGDTVLATWYTHDVDGAPLWLSVGARKTGRGTYAGDLYRKEGARFDAFDAAAVRTVKVGTANFTFANEDNATFAFAIDGPRAAVGQKAITRAVRASGAPCRLTSAVAKSARAADGSAPAEVR